MACQSFVQPLSGHEKAASNVLPDYHAMENLTSVMPQEDALDANATEVEDRVISWVRVSKGLSWMCMGARVGVVIFHTAGIWLNS